MAAVATTTITTHKVILTELTLKQINEAVKRAKKEGLTSCIIQSEYTTTSFEVNMGNCESLGYYISQGESSDKRVKFDQSGNIKQDQKLIQMEGMPE